MADPLFEEWRVYEKLLIHDYMDHRAFFTRLRAEVLTRFQRPLAILDLGCGDLAPVLPLLDSLPLRRYVGVDESEGALAMAARRLAPLGLPGQLLQDDLLTALEQIDGPFDLVLASFSLHHLAEPADKLRALQRTSRVLAADGLFALIDVFCQEQEPRARYVARWIANADARYEALKPAEKELLFDHVRARDYPLSLEQWRTLAMKAGFLRCEVLLEDQQGLNRLAIFAA